MLINNFAGTWDMVHDDWAGVLVINAPYQKLNAVDGQCTFTSYAFDGTYTDPNNQQFAVRGTIGGQDLDRLTNEPCKQSDHLLEFTIAFPGQPAQRFSGYLFTRAGRGMAGRTWWQGIPFGWYAIKR